MLTDLLPPDRIVCRPDADDKDAVLRALVGLAASGPVRDAEALLAAVRAREEAMSTGVGAGLALPHAYTDATTAPVAALALIPGGVPFDALDGEPVCVALLIAGPAESRAAHVRLLSRVSRVLGRADVRDALLVAPSPEAARAVLADAEAALG